MVPRLEPYLIVVARAWREPNGLRARVMIDRCNGSERIERASCHIDDLIELIRVELEHLEREIDS